jgi:integration host factor subunit alpha
MMTGNTITKADLSEVINQKVGLLRAESVRLLEKVLGEICDSLAAGEAVKLSGFGTFIVRSKSDHRA